MKYCPVTYSRNAFKGVCIPFARTDQEALCVRDLMDWESRETLPQDAQTFFTLRRDEKNLYITFTRTKTTPVRIQKADAKGDLWTEGDMAELLFGAIDPESWLLQLAVSATGNRFDSTGQYDSWTSEVTRTENSWTSKITLSLEKFLLRDLCCSFDIFIVDSDTGKVVTWSPVRISFHEFENYGTLFFCNDYETAYFAKTGSHPPRGNISFTRELFEKEMANVLIPAQAVLHGPWLHNMTGSSLTVSFATAGRAASFVEYRKVGENSWHRQGCDVHNAVIARHKTIHTAHLDSLKEGTLYEYRLLTTLVPVEEEFTISPAWQFKTFSESAKEFSFAIYSDTHSDTGTLQKLLNNPEIKNVDFLADLGDLLSSTSGPNGYYEGFLDRQCECLQGEKPVVFCRGNHEQIGIFAQSYMEIFPKKNGKTYYAFRQGEICFVVMDSGNDHHPDDLFHYNIAMKEEQKAFLKELQKQEIFTTASKRIGFLHIPPSDQKRPDARFSLDLLQDLRLDGLFCGHVHDCLVMENGKARTRSGKVWEDLPELPYKVITSDVDTILVIHVAGSQLQGRVYQSQGTLLDTFTL